MNATGSAASIDKLREAKQQVVERYGNWTAHNIHLGGDLYTINSDLRGDEIAARRIVQIVADVSNREFSELHIADLACLEGLYGVELARQGASVVAIDGRESNLAKAQFAKDALDLGNLKLALDDVRNFSVEKYGSFDVVLCLGILYHLDTPDVFSFLKQMFDACTRCLIIDTHISLIDEASVTSDGKTYWGRYHQEHSEDESVEDRQSKVWASIDNARSFWFTRPSLLNVLSHVGFTSTYECHNPPEVGKHSDRVTLVAIKGNQRTVISSPRLSAAPLEDWPEHLKIRLTDTNAPPPSIFRKVFRYLLRRRSSK